MKLPKRAYLDIAVRTLVVTGLLAVCLTITATGPNSAFPAWIAVVATVLTGAGTFMMTLANRRFKEEMVAPARHAQEVLATRSSDEIDYDALIETLSRPQLDPVLSRTGMALSLASFALVVGGLLYVLTH